MEPQLLTSLWNRSHQWLSDVNLIQMIAFIRFLSQDQPLFHCWKANRGLKLSRDLQTPENDHLHIYGLWYEPRYCPAYGNVGCPWTSMTLVRKDSSRKVTPSGAWWDGIMSLHSPPWRLRCCWRDLRLSWSPATKGDSFNKVVSWTGVPQQMSMIWNCSVNVHERRFRPT